VKHCQVAGRIELIDHPIPESAASVCFPDDAAMARFSCKRVSEL
jgi:hypothetical protein